MVNFYVKVIAHKLEFESSHKAESIKGVREVTGGPAPSQTESLEHQASGRSSLWNIKPPLQRVKSFSGRSSYKSEKIPIHSRWMSDEFILTHTRHQQPTVKIHWNKLTFLLLQEKSFCFRRKGNEFVHRNGNVPFLSSVQVSQVKQVQTTSKEGNFSLNIDLEL